MAHGKIVSPMLGVAAEEQRLLAHRVESVTTVAANLRNGRERNAILHGDALAGFVERNRRTRKMFKRDLAHPRISYIFHRDGAPGMAFVLNITGVECGFEGEVFDTHLRDATWPIERRHYAPAEFPVQRCGERGVHCDAVAFDGFH